MSAARSSSERRADPQQTRAGPGGHVIWGGVDSSSFENSENSWSWQSAEKEGKKRILAGQIDAQGIELLSDSNTESSSKDASKDDSSRSRKEKARHMKEKETRKGIINAILNTEMSKHTKHNEMVKATARSSSAACEESSAGQRAAAAAPASAGAAAASAAAGAPQQPRDFPPGLLPSVGSVGHAAGTCKPCLFLFENVGCQDGDECTFCHFPHNRKSSARQSKGKRDRFKKLLAKVEAMTGSETTPAPQARTIMSL